MTQSNEERMTNAKSISWANVLLSNEHDTQFTRKVLEINAYSSSFLAMHDFGFQNNKMVGESVLATTMA